MIQVVPQIRIYLATDPIDFRKGIDGLCRLCRAVLNQDPFSGYMFLFTNKKRVGIKILVYDGQGFWLCYKRLSKGRLVWWPRQSGAASLQLSHFELQSLLQNINPTGVSVNDFRKVRQP